MRKAHLSVLFFIGVGGCAESSPVAPALDPAPSYETISFFTPRVEGSFTLLLTGAEEAPSEAWGLLEVRAGLAPPNPCGFYGRRLITALTVCGVVYNPAFERLDAMSLEVEVGGEVTVVRGFLSAPPSPCNIALVVGVLDVDVVGATSVVGTVETDVGLVRSNATDWPGSPAAPPSPCVITLTLG